MIVQLTVYVLIFALEIAYNKWEMEEMKMVDGENLNFEVR